MEERSGFIEHTPCPECKSSDARAIYGDGHGYCFSCSTYFKSAAAKAPSGDHVEGGRRFEGGWKPIGGDITALTKRQITRDTCAKFAYRVAKSAGQYVQVADYHDAGGNLVAQHIRYPNKEFTWVGDAKKAVLWGQHLWQSGGRRLVITEGEIDCMTISQAFKNTWPVVSLPNGAQSAAKAIKRSLEFVESFQEVVLAFDDDEAGRKAVEDVAPMLTPGKVKIMSYNGAKDANEMLMSGKGHAIAGQVFGARTYRPDGIVSGADLWEELIKPPVTGIPIPYPKTQAMLMGLKPGELVMFTAGSGIGKSTLVHEIGYHLLVHHEQTIGVMALEENKVRAAERYLSIALEIPLHLTREGVTQERLRQAFEKTVGSNRFWLYDHFGSTAIDNLLSKIRYMVVGLGVQWIVLDHISIVVSGLDNSIHDDERRMLDKLMTRLRSLVEETGCGLLGVVHLRRPDNGKSYNEGRQVSLTDLRGSAAIEQLSDTVIAMERDQQSETDANYSLVRVLKNRRVGLCGAADWLLYTHETGRLQACDPPNETTPF